MIQLLSDDALGAELPPPAHTGINPLFRARITVDGESRQCYIKPQPDLLDAPGTGIPNREIVNEVVGYLLARACHFRVPAKAGVILLRREQIPARVLGHADRIAHGAPQADFLCWFSEDTGYRDLFSQHASNADSNELRERLESRIAQDIVSRKELPALVSFDEWTLNPDRHPGNVLGSASTYLTLIDHGRLFGSSMWHSKMLARMTRCVGENQMLAWADKGSPGWAGDKLIQSQRAVAYAKFIDAFSQTGQSTVRDTLADLSVEGDEIDSILDCLNARLDPDHTRSAIGLVV